MTKLELEDEIRQLYIENSYLKDTVKRLTEQLNGMQLSLSIEETIEAFRQQGLAEKSKPVSNPFFSLFGSSNSGNENDGLSDEKMNPDQLADFGEDFSEDIKG